MAAPLPPSLKQLIKDYFTFSVSQRRALITIIIVFLLWLGYLAWWSFRQPQSTEQIPLVLERIASLKAADDSLRSSKYSSYEEKDREGWYRSNYPNNKQTGSKNFNSFPFDPNTADANTLQALGLSEKTIATLFKYRNKGGKFREPNDLRKLYGLKEQDADRLIPWVQIASQPSNEYIIDKPVVAALEKLPKTSVNYIDINTADTITWQSLPGIGTKLAARIVNFRDKLGGFANVAQVGETYGVPDSTFQKIKTRLVANSESIKKININNADINLLKTHPYLRWNVANAIVQYRQQHGNFTQINDLLKIHLINDSLLNKVRPYLILE